MNIYHKMNTNYGNNFDVKSYKISLILSLIFYFFSITQPKAQVLVDDAQIKLKREYLVYRQVAKIYTCAFPTMVESYITYLDVFELGIKNKSDIIQKFIPAYSKLINKSAFLNRKQAKKSLDNRRIMSKFLRKNEKLLKKEYLLLEKYRLRQLEDVNKDRNSVYEKFFNSDSLGNPKKELLEYKIKTMYIVITE